MISSINGKGNSENYFIETIGPEFKRVLTIMFPVNE